MRTLWRRIRDNWDRTDSLVALSNTSALVVFVGNCWWESMWVCSLASAIPLAGQIWHGARTPGPLRDGLIFGALIAGAWPIGEGLVTALFGWWGEYLAPGPVIWHTPVYCILIGWLASTHIFYVGRRTVELGYGRFAAVLTSVFTGFLLGLVGENLFVLSGMWRYHASELDWFSIPAFVPLAYGLGYGVLPLLHGWRIIPATALCGLTIIVSCVSLGLVTGFFPR